MCTHADENQNFFFRPKKVWSFCFLSASHACVTVARVHKWHEVRNIYTTHQLFAWNEYNDTGAIETKDVSSTESDGNFAVAFNSIPFASGQ